MGYVYKITNLIDGKIYIGKSVSNYLHRYKEHLRIANNWEEMQQTHRSHLYSAMYKYGVENFEIGLVEECSNDILSERERHWISKFNSQDPVIGYNIAYGGAGGDTFSSLTEDEKTHRREQMSLNLRGKTKGYVAIHKDTVNKRVPPEVLEDYLTNGWEKGVDTSIFSPHAKGYKQSPESIRKRLESIANRSDEEKLKTSRLHSESTKKQMSLLSPQERTERARKARNAKRLLYPNDKQCWIHKDTLNKFIYSSELLDYISQGWEVGRIDSEETTNKKRASQRKAKHASGYAYVYKGDECIKVDNSLLDQYLSTGWERGNLHLRGIKKSKTRVEEGQK